MVSRASCFVIHHDYYQFLPNRVDRRPTDRAAEKVSGLGLGTNEGTVTPSECNRWNKGEEQKKGGISHA